MKLWFDDERPAPAGWHWAKTVAQAQEAFLTEEVTHAALDHDMGLHDIVMPTDPDERMDLMQTMNLELAPSGFDLAKWLDKNPDLIPPEVTIHSWNPAGAMRMAQVLAKHCHVIIEPF